MKVVEKYLILFYEISNPSSQEIIQSTITISIQTKINGKAGNKK